MMPPAVTMVVTQQKEIHHHHHTAHQRQTHQVRQVQEDQVLVLLHQVTTMV